MHHRYCHFPRTIEHEQQVSKTCLHACKCHGRMHACTQIKPEEVDIFLKGGGALNINSVKKKPKVHILPQPTHYFIFLL